ncbi:class I SAM-dependent methyltransferase [Leeia sp. TBRC 13508]|uniref:Class I SAM-dependent methyltransferase n=1 Tax=Leeia speluncae TaxID=2884804 RepID=A0ABS8D3P5_9NEIS|nr:class I SAM-dependent methyltransferase [Leeia speluncae]MCB6182792.1 class I SAM-dependent methyltransferase [Leeia speluncae]
MNNKIEVLKDLDELKQKLRHDYKKFKRVLDVGCGIRPFSWVPSESIVCVEPHDKYREILSATFANEGLITINSGFPDFLKIINVEEYNLISLIDVIEHLPKEVGISGLKEIIDGKPSNIFVFTPNGFMPQHSTGIDAWGIECGMQQEHLSGWCIEDFKQLGFNKFLIVKDLHVENEKRWDGLLAIYSIENNKSNKSSVWDPIEYPNSPNETADTVIIFGRHNRFSGSVVGTHVRRIGKKVYIPSLSFLSKKISNIYKKIIVSIVRGC